MLAFFPSFFFLFVGGMTHSQNYGMGELLFLPFGGACFRSFDDPDSGLFWITDFLGLFLCSSELDPWPVALFSAGHGVGKVSGALPL